MPRARSVPSYRLHKPSGQAVVTLRTAAGERQDVYLGVHDSPESRAEYGRLIAERAENPATVVPTTTGPRLTVDQLALAFLKHAEERFRRDDGSRSAALAEYKVAIRPLHQLYGNTAAADFGPKALKTVRNELVGGGVARKTVNARVGKLRRVFKWGAAEELIPVTTFTALATVEALEPGHTTAPDHEPVAPVAGAVVDATLPRLTRPLRGLIQFLRLTGCRPSEAARLRRCDIDTNGTVWVYRPHEHKTKHKGKSRAVTIGPKAQALLREFFTDDPGAYLFSPRNAVAERNAARRAARVTPMTPSQAARKAKANPKRPPSERYGREAILTAVVRACAEAFPPAGDLARKEGESIKKWRARLTPEQREAVKAWQREHQWFPYQLRHLFGTEVRKTHGLEAAQVLLGHSRADVTQLYAERNEALAAKVAAEIG